MKFNFTTDQYEPEAPLRIGNVYSTRGGRRLRNGDYWVLVSINDAGDVGHLLAVNREGRICGAAQYGVHVLRDWSPVAFATGVEDMVFDVVSI